MEFLFKVFEQVTLDQWLAVAAGTVITIGVTEWAKRLPIAPSPISARYAQWIQAFAFLFGAIGTTIVWPHEDILHRAVFGLMVGFSAPFVYYVGKLIFRRFVPKDFDAS